MPIETYAQIGGLNSDIVVINVVDGLQWDSMIKWINETNNNAYNNAGHTGVSTINTGSNEAYKVNNIYDLAGNVAEWSGEFYTTESGSEYVTRGGSYLQSNIKANQREHNNGEASEEIGFRQMIVLPVLPLLS